MLAVSEKVRKWQAGEISLVDLISWFLGDEVERTLEGTQVRYSSPRGSIVLCTSGAGHLFCKVSRYGIKLNPKGVL